MWQIPSGIGRTGRRIRDLRMNAVTYPGKFQDKIVTKCSASVSFPDVSFKIIDLL